MQYFGFDRPSFGIKTFGFGSPPPLVSADFMTKTYLKNGLPSSFGELFGFNRASKAWLVSDAGLNVFDADIPRFKDGLLVEESSTNLFQDSEGRSGVFLGTAATEVGVDLYNIDSGGYMVWLSRMSPAMLGAPLNYSIYSDTDSIMISDAGSGTISGVSFNGSVLAGADVVDISMSDDNRLSFSVMGETKYGEFRLRTPTHLSTFMTEMNFSTTIKLRGMPQITHLPLTSYIPTAGSPVTRAEEYLYNLDGVGTTITGDWDDTLTLTMVGGYLEHTGYGVIRSIEIN